MPMTEPNNRRLRDQFSGTPTFVAENMRIVGNLHGNGPVVVCGRIEGDGEIAGGVQLAAGARWQGNMHAEFAIVAGHIEGNVSVDEKLEVGFSAVIKGKVRAKLIAIASGAVIEGEIQVTGSAAPTHFSEKRVDK
jgi:cytoskeletal protein CcmA (bactofilin family)